MKKNYIYIIAVLLFIAQGTIRSFSQTFTFTYTDTAQLWTVPPCVTSIEVNAVGATGGHSALSRGGSGGNVHCMLAVTPGAILGIYVAGAGDTATATLPGGGSFNGGAAGGLGAPITIGFGFGFGGGGGGATDIRLPPYTLYSRVIVAAGGGGGGSDLPTIDADKGGDGGGLTGGNGYGGGAPGPFSLGGAYGGTASAGGAGGTYTSWIPGDTGTFGFGGGCGAILSSLSNGGGGGGGGWYGGGGGSWGGGGGGSSYANLAFATSITNLSGFNAFGDGYVTITIPCSPPGAITSGTSLICPGDSVFFSDTGTIVCGTWSSNDTTICVAGTSPGYIKGITAGTAVITYNLTNPCGGVSAFQTVTILPGPAAITGGSRICPSDSIQLYDTTPSGYWSSTDSLIANPELSGMIRGISTGTATILYTIADFCTASETVIVDCSNGIAPVIASNKYGIELFPNPANENLTIKMNEMAYHSFAITNSMGQVLITQPLSTLTTCVNINRLPTGLYYIILKGPHGSHVQKFIKE